MRNCRVCLEIPNTSIAPLTEKFQKLFYQITGIKLATYREEILCEKCMKILLIAYKFRSDALKAEEWFQNQYRQLKTDVNIIKSEIYIDENAAQYDKIGQISSPKKPKPYKCDLCGDRFTCYRGIFEHIRGHRKELGKKCRFCDETFPNRTTMTYHERKHISKMNRISVICEICGKTFSDARGRLKHEKSHYETYKCTFDGCEKFFPEKKMFYLHLKEGHGIKSPVCCNDCGKGFSGESSLSAHRRLFHPSDPAKLLHCPECPDKKFAGKSNLEEHIKSKHRGERNVCLICEKTYSSVKNMRRHYKSSHFNDYLEMVRSGKLKKKMRKLNQDLDC